MTYPLSGNCYNNNNQQQVLNSKTNVKIKIKAPANSQVFLGVNYNCGDNGYKTHNNHHNHHNQHHYDYGNRSNCGSGYRSDCGSRYDSSRQYSDYGLEDNRCNENGLQKAARFTFSLSCLIGAGATFAASICALFGGGRRGSSCNNNNNRQSMPPAYSGMSRCTQNVLNRGDELAYRYLGNCSG